MNSSELLHEKKPTYNMLVIFFLALAAPSGLYMVLSRFLGEGNTLLTYLNLPLQSLSFLGFAIWQLRSNEYTAEDLGISLEHLKGSIGISIVMGLANVCLSYLLVLASNILFMFYLSPEKFDALKQREQLGALQQLVTQPHTYWVIGYVLLIVCVLAPIAEELFFRGYLYESLKRRYDLRTGALVNSLLFALIHFYVISFIPIFVLGLLLTYIREKCKTIIAPMIVHLVYNLIAVVIIFYPPA
jgi:membrane protease YdiL (CAAX protease family)